MTNPLIVPEVRVQELDEVLTGYEEALHAGDSPPDFDGETPAQRAWSYLTDKRGLTVDTIKRFRLGVVDSPRMGHGHRGWLVIPYLGLDNRPLTVRFRCLQDHDCGERGHGKYAGLADEPTRIFNVRASSEADMEIHLAEGEFCAMWLEQMGYNAMAIPGVQNFKPHHRAILNGFPRVYVWGDGDEPGQKFDQRVMQACPAAISVPMPDGMDVDGLGVEQGEQAVRDLLESVRKDY